MSYVYPTKRRSASKRGLASMVALILIAPWSGTHASGVPVVDGAHIGVNKFADNEAVKTNDIITADLSVAERQIARVNEMKAHRDQHAVDSSLKALKEAAKGEANLMPYLIDAVKTYATLGEICGVLREVFGEYQQGGNLF